MTRTPPPAIAVAPPPCPICRGNLDPGDGILVCKPCRAVWPATGGAGWRIAPHVERCGALLAWNGITQPATRCLLHRRHEWEHAVAPAEVGK